MSWGQFSSDNSHHNDGGDHQEQGQQQDYPNHWQKPKIATKINTQYFDRGPKTVLQNTFNSLNQMFWIGIKQTSK